MTAQGLRGGYYWVKETQGQEWEVGYWTGSAWQVTGLGEDLLSVFAIGPKIDRPEATR